MAKLTKKAVDALSCGKRPAFLWDDTIAGFGVKALPSGVKKYLVKYRANGGGRAAPQRWLTLGSHGQITCDQARKLAQQAAAAVTRGQDPQAEKFKRRTAPKLVGCLAAIRSGISPAAKTSNSRGIRKPVAGPYRTQVRKDGRRRRLPIGCRSLPQEPEGYAVPRQPGIGAVFTADDAGGSVGMACRWL